MRPHRQQPTRLPRPWDSPGKNTGVGCHVLLQCMKVKSEREVAQPCPTPSDPTDCSPPGSSVHGIFQARVLEWAAIAFSYFAAILLPCPYPPQVCPLGHFRLTPSSASQPLKYTKSGSPNSSSLLPTPFQVKLPSFCKHYLMAWY